MNDTALVFPAGQGRGPTNPFRPFQTKDVEQSIPARFARQVAENPDGIAVESADQRLTYAELNRAANRLAGAILDLRGRAAEPVAFLVGHGCPQITAIFGILKAGKIYVPLEAGFPHSRNASVLADARPTVLVTDNHHRDLAAQLIVTGCRLLNLDELDPKRHTQDPDIILAPDRYAQIVYTSGSTGRPKGIVNSHRNILHTTLIFTNNLQVAIDDRFLHLYSCAFAASAGDIFPCLLNGASLLPFDLKVQGISRLARWLTDKEITIFHSVPTVFRQLAASLTGAERFPNLRLVRVGGEEVTPRDVQLHRRHFPETCLFAISYGATELLAIRLCFVGREAPLSGPRMPVGYAIEETEVLIRNENGQEVEPGCVGELAVRSPYLAHGYWGKEDETEAAFWPDPKRPGARVYRTGDVGLLRPDGCLEYLGRTDFQVKVRGHRVEVAEIESALLALDGVKEAVVVGRESATGGRRLVAYIVPAAPSIGAGSGTTHEGVPNVSALRAALHETLPDYMIPSAFVMLNALPTTLNGKIDRLALPAPETARPVMQTPYARPGDPLQVLLTEAWQDCLNVKPVGIRDDFFELGGDSILAMDLTLHAEELCGRPVSQQTLLSAPTVEKLASRLLEQETNPACPPVVEIQGGDPTRRLFFCHGDFNGGGIYCVPLARQLGKDQPFFAVHAHGLADSLVPATIEEMAADRLQAIRARQSGGPYLLAGHCNGGLVAFEIAQQLVRQGQRVDFLAVIAPPCREQSQTVASAYAFSPLVVSAPWEIPSAAKGPVNLTGLSFHQRRNRRLQAYDDACSRYVVEHFPGDMTVIFADEDLRSHPFPESWRQAAANTTLHVMPGGHLSMLSSRFLPELAKLLRDGLAMARASRR